MSRPPTLGLAMSGEEYRAALDTLGLTIRGAARLLQVAESQTQAWAKRGPPAAYAALLRFMLSAKVTPDEVSEALAGPTVAS